MIHLKGMTWDHPRGYRCLEAASEHYAAQHGVSISWDRRSLQAFADAPIDDIAETYDFIILDHPHVGLIADSACLLPLEMPADAAEASLGGSLESYVWNGSLWAYPVDAACQVAVKRPDLCKGELPDWDSILSGSFSGAMVTPLLPVDAFDLMMTLVAGRGEEDLPVCWRCGSSRPCSRPARPKRRSGTQSRFWKQCLKRMILPTARPCSAM